MSQTLHPSSQNTRKKGGDPSFYIYIYIKHMGICFYTNRALFQIYNGHLKKFYAANIANKVTPLILINGGAYAVCRLLGKERINNRMSLAIVLKSALTFSAAAILGSSGAGPPPCAPRRVRLAVAPESLQ